MMSLSPAWSTTRCTSWSASCPAPAHRPRFVTSASRAKDLKRRPVYILGAGAGASDHDTIWQAPDITTTPVKVAASKAYEMSGYGPKDVQFAQVYD